MRSSNGMMCGQLDNVLKLDHISTHLRVSTLGTVGGAVYLALNTADAATAVQVCARRRLNVNIADVDVLAHRRAGALQVPNKRVVLLARRALEVLDRDVRDGQL